MKTSQRNSMWFTNLLPSRTKTALFCLIIPAVVMLCSCARKGVADFVAVSHDHRMLTEETCGILIYAVQNEMNELDRAGKLTDEHKSQTTELINRLSMMIRQSAVMDNYINATHVTDEILVQLIQTRLNREAPTVTVDGGDNDGGS